MYKDNGGVTAARLEGVRHASGEWIGFVDGDDFIDPEMYERLLGNAEGWISYFLKTIRQKDLMQRQQNQKQENMLTIKR